MKCLICPNEQKYRDLCSECWLGLKCFRRSQHLLGRAIAYLGPTKRKLRTKRQRRARMKENGELQKLVESQRADSKDRHLRVERAIERQQRIPT